MKAVRAAWWIWALAPMLIVAVLLLTGCAAERYLTEEQDKQFHEACAETGCVVIPVPYWRQIERALGLRGS